MDKLQLDRDEGILLQATEVERYGEKEVTLDEFILTNKNIFCIYEKRNGLFAKTERVIDTIPLESIKVINGKAQIMKITHPEYEDVVQILLKSNRREFFSFFDRKEEIEWINTINTTITGDETPLIVEQPKKKRGLFAKRGKNVTDGEAQRSSVKIAVESEQTDHKMESDSTSSKFYSQNTVNTKIKDSSNTLKLSSNGVPKTIFCWNCGAEHAYGVKFCPECGASVQVENKAKPTEMFQMEEHHQQSTYSERKQEYAGKITKCPNCGEVLKSFMANCPSCGYEIRDIKASSTVREFTLKLEQIEAQKMPVEKEQKSVMETILGRDFKREEDIEASAKKRFEEQKNKEKANLIRNFSVPNTKEDMLEFLILSSTNIRDKHSMNDIVSKAWISKSEQVYQKAKISYISDSDFSKIQDIYNQVHSKVVSKRKIEIVTKNIGAWCGLIALIVAVIVDISGGNSSMIELVGCILLIFSASILEKRGAYFLEFGIGAISGVITIGLSFLLDNGSMLELCGGIILIVVAVNFFRSIVNNH